jgi:hypothetical protein
VPLFSIAEKLIGSLTMVQNFIKGVVDVVKIARQVNETRIFFICVFISIVLG